LSPLAETNQTGRMPSPTRSRRAPLPLTLQGLELRRGKHAGRARYPEGSHHKLQTTQSRDEEPHSVTTHVSWGCTLNPTSGLVPIAGTQSRAHALSPRLPETPGRCTRTTNLSHARSRLFLFTPQLGGESCSQSPPNLGGAITCSQSPPNLGGAHLALSHHPTSGSRCNLSHHPTSGSRCIPTSETPNLGNSQSSHPCITLLTSVMLPGTRMTQRPTRNRVTRPLGLRGERQMGEIGRRRRLGQSRCTISGSARISQSARAGAR
jgi:hypothetical protein